MEKTLKKSAADKIGMLQKGCKISKSLSPVIRHAPDAATDKSKNLLSLGSRQAVMVPFGKKITELRSSLSIISSLSPSSRKYLSNFFWEITSINSCKVGSEIANVPLLRALSKAPALTDVEINAALIRVFVSKTKKLVFFIQNLIKRFLGKTTFCHFSTQFVQVLLKVVLGIFEKLFSNLRTYFIIDFFSFFRRASRHAFARRSSTSSTILSIKK